MGSCKLKATEKILSQRRKKKGKRKDGRKKKEKKRKGKEKKEKNTGMNMRKGELVRNVT